MMGRYDETIAQYRRVLALDSTFVYGEPVDAAAWREKGELDSALVAYRRTQRALGGMPPPGLAITLARAGHIDEARQALRRMMELTKGRTGGWRPGCMPRWATATQPSRHSIGRCATTTCPCRS